jgi:hypothetical protein
MKQLILVLIVLFITVTASFSQRATSKTHAQKLFDSLFTLSRKYFERGKLDSIPRLNRQMMPLAQKINADSNFFSADVSIAEYFFAKSDYSQTFEYVFKALDIAQRGYRQRLPLLYSNIGLTYIELDNYPSALYYLHKGQQYLPLDDWGDAKIAIATNLAYVYQKMAKPDSALKYIQLAYQLNLKKTHDQALNQAEIYRNFGLVYEQLNEPALVDYYYKKGIRYSDSVNIPSIVASASKYYSEYLIKQQKYTDAKHYALLSFNNAKKMGFKKGVIGASDLLYILNDQHGRNDSAYYYLKIKNLYQDSVITEQKTNQMQASLVNQQLKEAEQNAKAAQEQEQRVHNEAYAAIAFGLILLMIVFLLLSRSIIVNTRVIEIIGVIGLLIIFEFINLVLHPYLTAITNDSPLLMLLILVLIAAVIVPLHHQLEQWIKHKLVEKNKAIRLATAKRTIEKLEGNL